MDIFLIWKSKNFKQISSKFQSWLTTFQRVKDPLLFNLMDFLVSVTHYPQLTFIVYLNHQDQNYINSYGILFDNFSIWKPMYLFIWPCCKCTKNPWTPVYK